MGQAATTVVEEGINAIAEKWRERREMLRDPEHDPDDDDDDDDGDRDMGPRQALPDERVGDASLPGPALGKQSIWNLVVVDPDLSPSQHWFTSPDKFELQASGHASRHPAEADPTDVEDDGEGGLGGFDGNEMQWEDVPETRPLLAADRSGSGPLPVPKKVSIPRPQSPGQTQQGSVGPSGEAAPTACAMSVPPGIGSLDEEDLKVYLTLAASLENIQPRPVNSTPAPNAPPDDDLPPPYTPQAPTPGPSNGRTPLPDGPSPRSGDGEWRYNSVDGEWQHRDEKSRDGEWQHRDEKSRDGEWRYNNEQGEWQHRDEKSRDGEPRYNNEQGEWQSGDKQYPNTKYGVSFSGRSPYDRNQRSIDFVNGYEASSSSLYTGGQPSRPPPQPPRPGKRETSTSSCPSLSDDQRSDSSASSSSSGRSSQPDRAMAKPIDIVGRGRSPQTAPSPEANLSIGRRQDFGRRVQFQSPPHSRPIPPGMPQDKGDTRWSSVHLRATRASIASNQDSKHTIKKQTLEERELRGRGMELHGPPPVKVRRKKHPTTIEGARAGGSPSSEPSSPELDYTPLGLNIPMPRPPPEPLFDPADEAIGQSTVRISNPSTRMGALMPKKHFPATPIEYEIIATDHTPHLLMLRRHECDTRCPEDCKEAGGKRKKGKDNAAPDDECEDDDSERSDDEGGLLGGGPEPMEGVEYANDQVEGEREPTKEEQDQDIWNTMGHYTVIERHRGQQVAEVGALTASGRLPASKRMNVSLNSKKERASDAAREDPARIVLEKDIYRAETRMETERENQIEYQITLRREFEEALLKQQAEELEARRHVRETQMAAKAARRAARAGAQTEEERARAASEVEAVDEANEVAVDSVSSGSSSGDEQILHPPVPSPPDDQTTAIHVEDTEMPDDPTTSHVEVVEESRTATYAEAVTRDLTASHVEEVPIASHAEAAEKSSAASHVAVVEVEEDDANTESGWREPPAIWILQRDGSFILNPLANPSTSAGAPSDPLPRRRWSSTSVGNIASSGPDPRPPHSARPRPHPLRQSETVSEGLEPSDLPPPSPRPRPRPHPLQRSVTVSEGLEPRDSRPRPPLRLRDIVPADDTPRLRLLIEPAQGSRPGLVRSDGRPRVTEQGGGQDDAMDGVSSEGGVDMTRPRLRREPLRVSNIRPIEGEPRGVFGPGSAALIADAGGSQIPLVVPSIETTNQRGGSDDEWLDGIDEGPVRRVPRLTTITTPPRPSEDDLPNRPQCSRSPLRTEILIEDIFSEDLDLTPAIEATHVPFSRAQSPDYFPTPSPLSGSRFVEELPELERFSSSYRETNAPSPVPLTTFTSAGTESDTPAATSVPATPASGPCPPRSGLDALARDQAAHVSRAFGVSVGGDGAGDQPDADDGNAGILGNRYFPSSPILSAPRPGPPSPPMEQYRRPSDASMSSLSAQQQQQRGEEIVAAGEREGSATAVVTDMVRGLEVVSPGGRQGSVTGEVAEMVRGLEVVSPGERDGEEELLRKREEEVSVQMEEEGGEEDAHGAPLQRFSSQAG